MTSKWVLIVTFICSFGLAACSSHKLKTELSADQRFLDVAANPKQFEGKEVTFRAWITLRHEDKNLWATMSDGENWETLRCVSLINYDSLDGRKRDLDGRMVEVTGTIVSDASEGGTIIRLGACRDVAIEISGPSAIKLVIP
ncbi:hypothetical protein [Pseudoxanthomonas sp. z9]|uniref:hypothetical protein n=1 Tax=Pseudoxanthomonas sp. z9 TaxID=2584942 RepID=UPI001145158B|nr:hypothetical protein [Pseudoxanthomonas sp. z9]